MLNLKFDKIRSADSFNIVSITENTATNINNRSQGY